MKIDGSKEIWKVRWRAVVIIWLTISSVLLVEESQLTTRSITETTSIIWSSSFQHKGMGLSYSIRNPKLAGVSALINSATQTNYPRITPSSTKTLTHTLTPVETSTAISTSPIASPVVIASPQPNTVDLRLIIEKFILPLLVVVIGGIIVGLIWTQWWQPIVQNQITDRKKNEVELAQELTPLIKNAQWINAIEKSIAWSIKGEFYIRKIIVLWEKEKITSDSRTDYERVNLKVFIPPILSKDFKKRGVNTEPSLYINSFKNLFENNRNEELRSKVLEWISSAEHPPESLIDRFKEFEPPNNKLNSFKNYFLQTYSLKANLSDSNAGTNPFSPIRCEDDLLLSTKRCTSVDSFQRVIDNVFNDSPSKATLTLITGHELGGKTSFSWWFIKEILTERPIRYFPVYIYINASDKLTLETLEKDIASHLLIDFYHTPYHFIQQPDKLKENIVRLFMNNFSSCKDMFLTIPEFAQHLSVPIEKITTLEKQMLIMENQIKEQKTIFGLGHRYSYDLGWCYPNGYDGLILIIDITNNVDVTKLYSLIEPHLRKDNLKSLVLLSSYKQKDFSGHGNNHQLSYTIDEMRRILEDRFVDKNMKETPSEYIRNLIVEDIDWSSYLSSQRIIRASQGRPGKMFQLGNSVITLVNDRAERKVLLGYLYIPEIMLSTSRSDIVYPGSEERIFTNRLRSTYLINDFITLIIDLYEIDPVMTREEICRVFRISESMINKNGFAEGGDIPMPLSDQSDNSSKIRKNYHFFGNHFVVTLKGEFSSGTDTSVFENAKRDFVDYYRELL